MALVIVLIRSAIKKVVPPEQEVWYASEVIFPNLKIHGMIQQVNTAVKKTFLLKWPGPEDKGHNPAFVEGKKWVSDDEALATIVASPADGPYYARVTTNGTIGEVNVKLVADVIPGEEEKLIESVVKLIIGAGEAVDFGEAGDQTVVVGEQTDVVDEPAAGGGDTAPEVTK